MASTISAGSGGVTVTMTGGGSASALRYRNEAAASAVTAATAATLAGPLLSLTAEIAALGAITADITTVAGISASVVTVAAVSANVTTVAGSIANVNTVATNIANVNLVGPISADVTTVAGISGNVTTVAGVAANVTTVAGVAANVTTVAGISADVTTVAGMSANVAIVAGDTADIQALGPISADIAAVSAVAADVTTVAGISGDIAGVANLVASGMEATSSLTAAKDLFGIGTNGLIMGERGVFTFAGTPVQADSSNDDFAVVEYATKPTWSTATEIIPITGASLAIGTASGSAISTGTPVASLYMPTTSLFTNGSGRVAHVEATVETMSRGLAEYIARKRVIEGETTKANAVFHSCIAGQGSQRIDQIDAPGETIYDKWEDQIGFAFTAGGAGSKVHVVPALIGGADGAIARATLTASIVAWQAQQQSTIQAITGQTDPTHLLMMQTAYSIKTAPVPALALMDAVFQSDYVHSVAAEYMFWQGDVSDHTHWSAIQQKWTGAFFGRAYNDIMAGHKPRVVWPRSQQIVVDSSDRAFLKFRTPTALRFNYDDLLATANHGLTMGSAGSATVAAEIWRGSTLVLQFSSLDLTTYPSSECRYAFDTTGTLFGLLNGASGNISDTTDEFVTISGNAYPMFNAMQPWALPIVRMDY